MSVHVIVANEFNVKCLLVFIIIEFFVFIDTVEGVTNDGDKSVQEDQIVEEQTDEPLEPNQVNVDHNCAS